MTCALPCQCGGIYRHRHETKLEFILVCDKCEAVKTTAKSRTAGARGGQDNEPELPIDEVWTDMPTRNVLTEMPDRGDGMAVFAGVIVERDSRVRVVRKDEQPGSLENLQGLARLLTGFKCCRTPQMCSIWCQDNELSATLAEAERVVRLALEQFHG